MRARLFVITSLAVATIIGGASAAYAHPQGPGDIKYQPTPTTQPQGPDKLAPKPTTTTTTPPAPKGPGDIANPQSDPVVDPAPTGDDNPTTMGDDEANLVDAGNGAVVEPVSHVSDGNPTATPAETHASSGVPTLVIILLAGLVGALLALLAARFRRQGEDAGRI